MLRVTILTIVMVSSILLLWCLVFYCYAERYIFNCYAECHYADYCYAKCRISIVMLKTIFFIVILSVTMLTIVM
jgi:hypothetical protein